MNTEEKEKYLLRKADVFAKEAKDCIKKEYKFKEHIDIKNIIHNTYNYIRPIIEQELECLPDEIHRNDAKANFIYATTGAILDELTNVIIVELEKIEEGEGL